MAIFSSDGRRVSCPRAGMDPQEVAARLYWLVFAQLLLRVAQTINRAAQEREANEEPNQKGKEAIKASG